ncbi:MAG: GNAT family N-acetyltransferase [Mycobacterium sp.]
MADMGEPTLRRATSDDVKAVAELATSAFTKYVDRIGRPPAPMVADYAELLGTSRVWILTAADADDDQLVGLLVTQARSDHLLLHTMAVEPAAQGAGHGQRLLQRADQDAVEQGRSEIRLYTNEAMTENLDFYPRRGYRETGRRLEDGYRRVFFVKNLAIAG